MRGSAGLKMTAGIVTSSIHEIGVRRGMVFMWISSTHARGGGEGKDSAVKWNSPNLCYVNQTSVRLSILPQHKLSLDWPNRSTMPSKVDS